MLNPPHDSVELVKYWADALRESLSGELLFDHAKPVCPPKPVSDDALKLGLFDKGGRCFAVAHCAPEGAPEVVQTLLDCSDVARKQLGKKLSSVILNPIKAGHHNGLSYCITPYRRPLHDGRVGRWYDRRRLRTSVLDWLVQATAKTCETINDCAEYKRIDAELAELKSLEGLDSSLLHAVGETRNAIAAEAWPIVQVLQHGDFWDGNLLVAPRADAWPFVIIDWPGSRPSGEPIFDLIRFAISVHLPDKTLGQQLKKHSDILGCKVPDTACHLLIALAGLSARLNNFPVDRFVVMANYNFARLNKAIATQIS